MTGFDVDDAPAGSSRKSVRRRGFWRFCARDEAECGLAVCGVPELSVEADAAFGPGGRDGVGAIVDVDVVDDEVGSGGRMWGKGGWCDDISP